MSEQTPLVKYAYPSEFEENFNADFWKQVVFRFGSRSSERRSIGWLGLPCGVQSSAHADIDDSCPASPAPNPNRSAIDPLKYDFAVQRSAPPEAEKVQKTFS